MEEFEDRRDPNMRRRATDRREDVLFERLARLEDSHNMMSKSVTKLEIVVENSVNLIERFENTLDKMANTLAELNITITKINQKVEDNSRDIEQVEGNVVQVKDKLKIIDDKGKIDFLELIKNNFSKAVFGGGALAIIFYWLDHLIDTWISLKK